MWFPDLVWENIRSFIFTVWGRNPLLKKKYDTVFASLPLCFQYTQPQRLIKFNGDRSIKFTIDLVYIDWFWEDYCCCRKCQRRGRDRRYRRCIKIYSLDI